MPNLAETAAMLASLKRRTAEQAQARFTQEGRASAAPSKGWAETAFTPNPGGLRLMRYRPDDLPAAAPLVVVLHGCGQTAVGYAEAAGWTALADRFGFAVLAPEQTSANNPNRCFNWFEPEDAQRGRGEAASIRAMIDHMVPSEDLDQSRIFITGLSAGGAMTVAMLACYPDVFAAGAVLAGVAFGVADNLPSALSAMYFPKAHTGEDLEALARRAGPSSARPPRLSIWHGDADATVKAVNAEEIARQWARLHGLPEEPTRVRTLHGRTLAQWLAPERGPGNAEEEPEAILIERHLIHGMGHGAPLAAQGPEGLGAAGPFMLEAGISSSLEIARFWGVAPPASAPARGADARAGEKAERRGPGAQSRAAADPGSEGIGAKVLASLGQIVSDDVRHVIEGAFRAAGLK